MKTAVKIKRRPEGRPILSCAVNLFHTAALVKSYFKARNHLGNVHINGRSSADA
jgi:hypothetical protein